MTLNLFAKKIFRAAILIFELCTALFLIRLCSNMGGASEGEPLFGWAMISPLAILPFSLCVLSWKFPAEKSAFRKAYIFSKFVQMTGGVSYLAMRLRFVAPQKEDFLEAAFIAANFFFAFAVYLKEIQNANNSDC